MPKHPAPVASVSATPAPAALANPPVAAEEKFTVTRAFNSENRRFAVTDPPTPIARDDLKGSRLDFDHMISRGYIARA